MGGDRGEGKKMFDPPHPNPLPPGKRVSAGTSIARLKGIKKLTKHHRKIP